MKINFKKNFFFKILDLRAVITLSIKSLSLLKVFNINLKNKLALHTSLLQKKKKNVNLYYFIIHFVLAILINSSIQNINNV
jgi:hypothetical protein